MSDQPSSNPGPEASSSISASPVIANETSISDSIVAEVVKEQQYQEINARVIGLEKKLESEKKLREDVQAKYEEERARVQQLEHNNSVNAATFSSTTQAVEDYKLKLDLLRGEKKELQDDLDQLRKKGRADNEEISKLRDRYSTDSDTIRRLERERLDAISERNSFEHNYNIINGALENSKKEVLSFSKSLVEVNAAFAKYRTSAQSEIEELNSKVTTLTAEIATVSKAKARLQVAYDAKSQKLSDSELACSDLRRQLDADRTAHRSAESKHQTEIEKYLRTIEEQRALVSAMEEDYEKIELAAKERVDAADQRAEAERTARTQAEENMKTLSSVAEMLGANRQTLDQSVSSEDAPSFELPGSSFALKNTGKTYAQIYADYINMHGKLNEANAEVQRLTSSLEEFLEAYNEKIPLIDAQYKENKELRLQNDDLAGRLAESENTRNKVQANLGAAESNLAKITADEKSLRSQVTDLALQVRILTYQVAIRDDPRLANEPFDPYIEVAELPESSIERVITEKLVGFKNLPELIQMNQQLLTVVRQLGDQLEAKNHKNMNGHATADTSDSDSALDEATTMINDLTEQLHKTKQQLSDVADQKDQYLRERDMFSHMVLQSQLNPASSSTLARGSMDSSGRSGSVMQTLQAEFSKFRDQLTKEKDGLSQRLEEKDGELRRMQESIARTQKALENQQHETTLLVERQNLEQSAVIDLQQQIAVYKAQVESLQRDKRKALEERDIINQELERVNLVVSSHQSEKSVWEEMNRKQAEALQRAIEAQSDLKRQIETRDLVSDSGTQAIKARTLLLEESVDRLQAEKDELVERVEQMKRGSIGLVPGLESQIRSLKTRVEELTGEITSKEASYQENLAKEIAEKEEFRKGNTLAVKYKHKMEQQEKELRLLRPRVAKAESEVSSLAAKLSSEETTRKQLEQQVQQLNNSALGEAPTGRTAELESQLQSQSKDLSVAQSELADLRSRLTKIQADLTVSQAAVTQEAAKHQEVVAAVLKIKRNPPASEAASTSTVLPWKDHLASIEQELATLRTKQATHQDTIKRANRQITASAEGKRAAERQLEELRQELAAKDAAAQESALTLAPVKFEGESEAPASKPESAPAADGTTVAASMAEISTAPAISTDVHVSNDTKRSDAEVQQLRESLARAQSELTRVTAELATVTAERDRLRTDLEQMNDEVEKLKKAAETTKAENEQVLTKLQQQLKTAEEKELRTAAQVSFKDNRLKRLEKELNEAKSKIGGVATPTTPAIPTGVPNKPVPTPATTAATASTKPSLSIRGSGVPPGASTEASSSSATVAPTPTATRGRGAPRARGVARGRGAARGRGGRPVNNMDILESVNSGSPASAAAAAAAASAAGSAGATGGVKRTADDVGAADNKRPRTGGAAGGAGDPAGSGGSATS